VDRIVDRIGVGLSLMIEPDFLAATLPLFERGDVDVLEWSIDLGWTAAGTPSWAQALLDAFSARDRLYAHGVDLSVLSAPWQPRHDEWLERAAREIEARRYRLVSEHFGFSTVPGVRRGAPLPVPYCDGAIEIGRTALARMRDVARIPVGLENLALAFDERDAWTQGRFLDELLSPVDGFLLLDAHNLHCQVENFGCDPIALLESYPLERVRLMHVSGGSFAHPRYGRIRQDTHDGAVPDGALALVEATIARAPNLEAVFFERLGGTVADEEDAQRMRADYETLRATVDRATRERERGRTGPAPPPRFDRARSRARMDARELAAYQSALHASLLDGEDAAERFPATEAKWHETTASYEPRMLRLASRIADRFTAFEEP
jgi:uncharacterized protein (UPF0276 family)